MMFFFKKNEKKSLVNTKKTLFTIENTNFDDIKKITLKPIHAVYYNTQGNLEEIIIPRFFVFKIIGYYDYYGGRNKVPVKQAVAIQKFNYKHFKETRKEKWFEEILYVTQKELERYSIYAYMELKLNKTIKNVDTIVEEIEFKDEYFGEDLWYYRNKNYTCAKIYDFYHNMDKEIITAFGSGLFDSLKTYLELYHKLGKFSVEESNKEICSYINKIYETAISMGENLEEFPTILDYINIKNEEELRKKQEELEKRQKLKEKQSQLIRDLKIRQSLLDDFNAPLECNGKGH